MPTKILKWGHDWEAIQHDGKNCTTPNTYGKSNCNNITESNLMKTNHNLSKGQIQNSENYSNKKYESTISLNKWKQTGMKRI